MLLKRFFISDFHFGHDRDFIYRARGFNSIQEHDEELVARFNSRVTDADLTYFLGDFCFQADRIVEMFMRLNGQFVVVLGNHDKALQQMLNQNSLLGKVIEYTVNGFYNLHLGKKHPLTVSHFAMHSWEKSHFNAYHLYGHHHTRSDFGGKTLNVTVDNLNGYPISDEEVLHYMSSRGDNWDYMAPEQTGGWNTSRLN